MFWLGDPFSVKKLPLSYTMGVQLSSWYRHEHVTQAGPIRIACKFAMVAGGASGGLEHSLLPCRSLADKAQIQRQEGLKGPENPRFPSWFKPVHSLRLPCYISKISTPPPLWTFSQKLGWWRFLSLITIIDLTDSH